MLKELLKDIQSGKIKLEFGNPKHIELLEVCKQLEASEKIGERDIGIKFTYSCPHCKDEIIDDEDNYIDYSWALSELCDKVLDKHICKKCKGIITYP